MPAQLNNIAHRNICISVDCVQKHISHSFIGMSWLIGSTFALVRVSISIPCETPRSKYKTVEKTGRTLTSLPRGKVGGGGGEFTVGRALHISTLHPTIYCGCKFFLFPRSVYLNLGGTCSSKLPAPRWLHLVTRNFECIAKRELFSCTTRCRIKLIALKVLVQCTYDWLANLVLWRKVQHIIIIYNNNKI